MKVNSSEQLGPWTNISTWPPIKTSITMSCFTMTFGAISNLTALGILARSHLRFRRQSKGPFLQLTVALLVADLGSQVIPGAFAIYLHMDSTKMAQPTTFCQVFGASMVFFGLCPLLFGCAMAAERCVAITQPFFHASTITVTHVRRVVLVLTSVAFMLAILPLCDVGTYRTQYPGTWCFLPIYGSQSAADTSLILAFLGLGLTALALSLLCNFLSGMVLLLARVRHCVASKNSNGRCSRRPSMTSTSSSFCSLDIEMMVQLVVLTVVSCVCWSPFLIRVLAMQVNGSPQGSNDEQDDFTLLSLRMASWNQILDPWVYILLRRAVLLQVCCLYTRRSFTRVNSSFVDRRPETFVLH